MATSAEQPCYTLINIPTDSDMPNEMQLRQDLGKRWLFTIFYYWKEIDTKYMYVYIMPWEKNC